MADWFLSILSLIFMTLFAVGMSFYPMFWCLSFLVSDLLQRLIVWITGANIRLSKNKPNKKLEMILDIGHCCVMLFPLSIHYVVIRGILDVFIPIMGRSGTEV